MENYLSLYFIFIYLRFTISAEMMGLERVGRRRRGVHDIKIYTESPKNHGNWKTTWGLLERIKGPSVKKINHIIFYYNYIINHFKEIEEYNRVGQIKGGDNSDKKKYNILTFQL